MLEPKQVPHLEPRVPMSLRSGTKSSRRRPKGTHRVKIFFKVIKDAILDIPNSSIQFSNIQFINILNQHMMTIDDICILFRYFFAMQKILRFPRRASSKTSRTSGGAAGRTCSAPGSSREPKAERRSHGHRCTSQGTSRTASSSKRRSIGSLKQLEVWWRYAKWRCKDMQSFPGKRIWF